MPRLAQPPQTPLGAIVALAGGGAIHPLCFGTVCGEAASVALGVVSARSHILPNTDGSPSSPR